MRYAQAPVRTAAAILLLVAHAAGAQGPGGPASLRVVVKDQTGAVLPGARVQVAAAETPGSAIASATADGQGVATLARLTPGRYAIAVSFPGFETRVVSDVRLRGRDVTREVTLVLDKLDESVQVGRMPDTAATDPRSGRFSNVLTREEIDALPDDPDEMERVLKEMAGPGGTIRVDGFRGERLPPKAQIRSIRFASGMFAAENHGGGMTFVDLETQPGAGALRGSVDVTFRNSALTARNAFQQEEGPERSRQYGFNLGGTLIQDRTSFALSAVGTSLYDSANLFAALPDGSRSTGFVRRPSDRLNVSARVDHALSPSRTLRGTFQQHHQDQHHLGVGGFDLPDRAFSRTASDRTLRLSESGPLGRSLFAETRLQVRWTRSETDPLLEAPAVQVLGSFTAGGAQQSGGRRTTEIEWGTHVDWARGRHAIRMGALLEGGRFRGDLQTNYLGTYTFTSLAEYAAGLPSMYTRRTGAPLVSFSHWQAGLFIQDDWRARRNLTLSAGLRQEIQTHLADRVNLAPRAGFLWSPFRHGRTTLRGGGGIFHDWLEAEVYEQTLRVDGVRQEEIVVRNPGFPDPFTGGAPQALPAGKYTLAEALVMPSRTVGSVGVSQQVTSTVMLNVTFTAASGTNRFRGRNGNAPLGGVRPDPLLGNVLQVESTGRMRSRQLHAGLNLNLPSRRAFLFVNYSFADQMNDADGPFSIPADSYDVAAEWGPAAGIPRHSLSTLLNVPVGSRIRLGVTAIARSATRYNIITGRDDNGDTIFTDRPAGAGRNSGMGDGMWDVAARLSYAFGFGHRETPGPGGSPVVIVRGAGGGSAGDLLGAVGGTAAEDKRVRIELFASAANLFNTVNATAHSGVMTSPFFGEPTAALPARRVELGVRVGF